MKPQLAAWQIGLVCFAAVATVSSVTTAALYTIGVSNVVSAPLGRYPANRVLAAPYVVEVGDPTSRDSLVEHLTRLGYFETTVAEAGTFDRNADGSLHVRGRAGSTKPITVTWVGDRISGISDAAGVSLQSANFGSEEIVARESGGGAVLIQDELPLAAYMGTLLIDALIASEDGAFWEHQGVDLRRLPFVWLLGGGASTLTQQVARVHVLRDRSPTILRKAREIGTAMALERRYGKPAILRAYLNSAYLGNSHGRQIRGFAAASRIFFNGKDVRKLDMVEATTLVALLNQPVTYLRELRDGDDTRLRRQRNRVMRLMSAAHPELYQAMDVEALSSRPVILHEREPQFELWDQSRHFLDHVGTFAGQGLPEFVTTLVPDWQRAATKAVQDGLTNLERARPSHFGPLQAALVAIRPSTGEIVALVGGRSYQESQFNRAVDAKRPAGSATKPFVYLAAIGSDGSSEIGTPSTMVQDTPYSLKIGNQVWMPANHGGEYQGAITWRRALERSSNVAAVRIAESVGFDVVARTWGAAIGRHVAAHPSVVLGSTEVSPLEVARAYRVFADDSPSNLRAVVVRDMLRGVVEAGTASALGRSSFKREVAGKTGTTNDYRDAWFVGFTPDLLAVVWVGRDDNSPIGMTGAQAALPIWTAFMTQALSEKAPKAFAYPPTVVRLAIDPDSGHLATAACPRTTMQSYLVGTAPALRCRHGR